MGVLVVGMEDPPPLPRGLRQSGELDAEGG